MKKKIISKLVISSLAAALTFTCMSSINVQASEKASKLYKESTEVGYVFVNKQVGEDVYAKLSSDGVLTLSGTGPMYDYPVPSGVSYISSLGFFKYYSIRELVIEDGITYIGEWAFANCDNMTKVSLGADIVSIGSSAFYNADVEKLVCPASLKTIGSDVFRNNYSLTSITLNDGVESIADGAFMTNGTSSRSINEAIIPENCIVSSGAFYGTTLHKKTYVTLNANGGTVNDLSSDTIVRYIDETYDLPTTLPTPVREGYDFLGWYIFDDGEIVGTVSEEKVTYRATLIAQWCNHSDTELRNEKEPTYINIGYTGDMCCSSCGKILEYGISIDKKILPAPKLLSVENASKGIKIKWNASDAADGYYVFCNINGGYYEQIANVKTTSYIDQIAKSNVGSKYSYKICAYKGNEVDGIATSKFTTAKSQVRITSSKIKNAISPAKGKVTITCKNIDGVSGYQLQYSKDKAFKTAVAKKNLKTNKITISKLSSNTTYYIRVRSYVIYNNKKYYSPWSTLSAANIK